jgi:hypothetical protein
MKANWDKNIAVESELPSTFKHTEENPAAARWALRELVAFFSSILSFGALASRRGDGFLLHVAD